MITKTLEISYLKLMRIFMFLALIILPLIGLSQSDSALDKIKEFQDIKLGKNIKKYPHLIYDGDGPIYYSSKSYYYEGCLVANLNASTDKNGKINWICIEIPCLDSTSIVDSFIKKYGNPTSKRDKLNGFIWTGKRIELWVTAYQYEEGRKVMLVHFYLLEKVLPNVRSLKQG